jgi:hypothetical protein
MRTWLASVFVGGRTEELLIDDISAISSLVNVHADDASDYIQTTF